MPPPMMSAVGHLEQRLDHAELVAHLGPAEDHHERAARVGAQRQQHLDLAGQQPTGRADGRNCGGPTIEAWARCDAPKASLT